MTAETIAQQLGYVLHIGDTAPGATTMYDVPVIWIDTSGTSAPVDPVVEVVPAAPVPHYADRTVEIPTTAGVEYLIDGQVVTGTVAVPPPYPATITVTARPAGGAVFRVGAVTSWVFEYAVSPVTYDDAVGSVEVYFRLDEPAAPVVNRGAAPVTVTTLQGALGAEGVGVGATSLGGTDADQATLILGGYARTLTAFTRAAVISTDMVDTAWWMFMQYGAVQTGLMLMLDAYKTHWMVVTYAGDGTQTNTYTSVPAKTSGVLHVAQTWDGTTLRTYLDGIERQAVEYSGSWTISASDFIAVAARAGNRRAGGIMVDSTQARDAAWVKALSDAVAR